MVFETPMTISGQTSLPPPPPLSCTYNPGMVKSAYVRGPQLISAGSPSLLDVSGGIVTTDVDLLWRSGAPAKGVIKMNRRFADLAPKPSKSIKNPDTKLYGFRFLYNPTSIDMAWGIVEQFSPQYEVTNVDKASVMSVGLMKSTIQFQLLLNRKFDMAAVGPFGLNHPEMYPDLGKPTNKDAMQIYLRGTMYDLDFLFRTTGGYNSTYKSQLLKQDTADRGWLQPIPVELHLGRGLRYLVRVSELSVNHMYFNERMVPLISQVTVTCTRYYDGPEMFTKDSESILSDIDTSSLYNLKPEGGQ
jgi:hypothetical protein